MLFNETRIINLGFNLKTAIAHFKTKPYPGYRVRVTTCPRKGISKLLARVLMKEFGFEMVQRSLIFATQAWSAISNASS